MKQYIIKDILTWKDLPEILLHQNKTKQDTNWGL